MKRFFFNPVFEIFDCPHKVKNIPRSLYGNESIS